MIPLDPQNSSPFLATNQRPSINLARMFTWRKASQRFAYCLCSKLKRQLTIKSKAQMIHGHVLSRNGGIQSQSVTSQMCPERHTAASQILQSEVRALTSGSAARQRSPTGHPLHLTLLRSGVLAPENLLQFYDSSSWHSHITENVWIHLIYMHNIQYHKIILRGHVPLLKMFHNAHYSILIPIKSVGRFPSYLPESKSSYLKTTHIGLQCKVSGLLNISQYEFNSNSMTGAPRNNARTILGVSVRHLASPQHFYPRHLYLTHTKSKALHKRVH